MIAEYRMIIIGTFAILFMAVCASAQPYIVSTTQQPEVAVYRMRLSSDNGATWGEWVEAPPVNNALKFDVRLVPKGLYKGEAQAGVTTELTDSATGQVSQVQEWSMSAGFTLNRKRGNAPSTLKMEQ